MSEENKELIFTGYFERNLDEKNRVAIPARLRSQLEKAQSKDEVIYVLYSMASKSIRIYTYDTWIRFVQAEIDAIDDSDKRARLMKSLYRFSEDQKMDAQGRIVLNKKFTQLFGIDKSVSISGMGHGIEIEALKEEEEDFNLTEEELQFFKDIVR